MKSNVRFLWKLFRPSSPALLFSAFLCFLGALLEGLSYSFLILALTSLFESEAVNFPILHFAGGHFVIYVLLGVLSQIVKSTLCFLATLINANVGVRLQSAVQMRIYSKIFHINFFSLNRYKMGELVELLRSPMLFFRPFLEHAGALVVSTSLIVVSLALMMFLSPLLTLFTLTLFGLSALLQKTIIKKSRHLSHVLHLCLQKFSQHAMQSLGGIRVIQLYNRKEKAKQRMENTLKRFESASRKLLISMGAIVSLNEIMGILLISFTLLAGYSILSWEGKAVLPILFGFMTITYRLSGKILGLMGQINQIAMLEAPFRQMKQILSKAGVVFESKSLKFEKEITFDDVTFAYPQEKKVVIDHFSFQIKKGEVVGLVGSTGSGKSTLIDLLAGLYTPTKGKILIDGAPLCEENIFSWREKLGVVSQEVFIFNETVEENLKLGNLHATLEEIEACARAACAHEFIMALPRRYQTVVGERGYRLSGGERQRIALARALLRHPEVLILDEATSNLDSKTEGWIQEFLEKIKGTKTVIIAAHRLSCVQYADTILVLEEGKIVEQGDHTQLMQSKGHYYHYWEKYAEKTV